MRQTRRQPPLFGSRRRGRLLLVCYVSTGITRPRSVRSSSLEWNSPLLGPPGPPGTETPTEYPSCPPSSPQPVVIFQRFTSHASIGREPRRMREGFARPTGILTHRGSFRRKSLRSRSCRLSAVRRSSLPCQGQNMRKSLRPKGCRRKRLSKVSPGGRGGQSWGKLPFRAVKSPCRVGPGGASPGSKVPYGVPNR